MFIPGNISSPSRQIESSRSSPSFLSFRSRTVPRRLINLISLWTCTTHETRFRPFPRKSCTESPPRDDQQSAGQCRMSVRTCAWVYARLASVCAYASVKLQKEYRTPSTVIVSLARVRLEPSPHLAFGLAGTSPPDRFYTFVSPTLANVRARSCSLPRSLAPRHVDSAHGQFHHGREDRSFFFFFLPLRTYVARTNTRGGGTQASRLFLARGHILGCSAGARTNERSREGTTRPRPKIRSGWRMISVDRSRFSISQIQEMDRRAWTPKPSRYLSWSTRNETEEVWAYSYLSKPRHASFRDEILLSSNRNREKYVRTRLISSFDCGFNIVDRAAIAFAVLFCGHA